MRTYFAASAFLVLSMGCGMTPETNPAQPAQESVPGDTCRPPECYPDERPQSPKEALETPLKGLKNAVIHSLKSA